MNSMIRTATARTLGMAGLAVLAAACGSGRGPGNPRETPQVSVVSVSAQSVPIVAELSGRTSPYLVAQVRARVDGIVLAREFKEGSDVKTGQRLYKIDPAPYIAALNSAAAALKKAEANVESTSALAERYRNLVAAGAVSQQEYIDAIATQRQALADVATAQASVDLARINLGYTDVVAPISGRVGLSDVTAGAYVEASAATLLTTIQQIDPIYVDLTQSTVQSLELRNDAASGRVELAPPDRAKVTVVLENGRAYGVPGSLTARDITVNEGTGSVTLRAQFANPDSVLLPGMFVRGRVQQGSRRAFLVPQIAVTHDASGQGTAKVVGAGEKVELRALRLVGTRADRWIVEDGLADGDRVIVTGGQQLAAGAVVRAVDPRPDAVAPAAGDRASNARAGAGQGRLTGD